MIITPVYAIKDYEKFEEVMNKFKLLCTAFSNINKHIKLKQTFIVKDKYIIPVILELKNYEDSLAYVVYWLLKEGAIELSYFYTSEGTLITRNKFPLEFKTYSELLNKIQGMWISFGMSVYKILSNNKVINKVSVPVVYGFEPRTNIDAGNKKIIGVRIYLSLTPRCEPNECYENKLYPKSSPIVKNDIIATFENGQFNHIYLECVRSELAMRDLQEVKFSIRDVILLLSHSKVHPYSKIDKSLSSYTSSKFFSEFINNSSIPPIIKPLIEINSKLVKFTGEKLKFEYESMKKIGVVNIDLKSVNGIIVSKTPITLSKFLKLNSKTYNKLGVIKTPNKLEDLFKPIDDKIDIGVYVKYKDLLIPLIMGNSGHYFIAYPLLCGMTLYGLLKGWLPYEVDKRSNIIVNYGGKVRVKLNLTNLDIGIINFFVKVLDEIIPTPDASLKRSVDIKVYKGVLKDFQLKLSSKAMNNE